jgi:hypothetical protein
MQLERQLRPEVYGWRRGGYLDSTVDERGSSTCSYAWADRMTSTSRNRSGPRQHVRTHKLLIRLDNEDRA